MTQSRPDITRSVRPLHEPLSRPKKETVRLPESTNSVVTDATAIPLVC